MRHRGQNVRNTIDLLFNRQRRTRSHIWSRRLRSSTSCAKASRGSCATWRATRWKWNSRGRRSGAKSSPWNEVRPSGNLFLPRLRPDPTGKEKPSSRPNPVGIEAPQCPPLQKILRVPMFPLPLIPGSTNGGLRWGQPIEKYATGAFITVIILLLTHKSQITRVIRATICITSRQTVVVSNVSLGVRKSIQPVKNWVMGYWRGYLSAVWRKWFAYGPADATATVISCFSKIQNCLPFWCRLTQVVLEKGPLKVCMYVYSLNDVFYRILTYISFSVRKRTGCGKIK